LLDILSQHIAVDVLLPNIAVKKLADTVIKLYNCTLCIRSVEDQKSFLSTTGRVER
jgi:hypothetical protein